MRPRANGGPPIAVPSGRVLGFVGLADIGDRRVVILPPRHYRFGGSSLIEVVSKPFANIVKGINETTKRRHIFVAVLGGDIITATCVPGSFVRG